MTRLKIEKIRNDFVLTCQCYQKQGVKFLAKFTGN